MTMQDYIREFPNHLIKALQIGQRVEVGSSVSNVSNVLIAGLGGSGIGGKIVSQLIADKIQVPVCVTHDYEIPVFADSKTLLIACSYSGNTEETLRAVEEAIRKGCQVVCITSGGQLKQHALERNWPLFEVPTGYPPRAALGFSLTALLFMFTKSGLVTWNFEQEVQRSLGYLSEKMSEIQTKAKELAEHLFKGVPVIYSEASFEGVAIRFRQQVNENAKMLCWHHVLPEMNHNELVGWGGGDNRFSVIVFRSDLDHERTKLRMELCKELIGQRAPYVEVFAIGQTRLEQSLYLIHLGDWISWYLSEMRGVDAVEVNVIDYLKGALAKQP